MTPKTAVSKIKKEFNRIKSRHRKKYGTAIFEISITISKNNPLILKGKVLSEKQKNEAFFAAKEILKGDKIKNEIKVLSNPEEKMETGWGIIKNDIADLWLTFFKKRANPNDKTRATQAVKGEAVRLLYKKDEWCLAQTSDLAIGWIKKRNIAETQNTKIIRKWKKAKRAVNAGKRIEVAKGKSERKKFVAFLEKYFNAPYLAGGVTEKGIDCSGLAQKFYLEIFRILLPRHSSDQAALGKEINFSQSRFGDIVFLRHREKKYPHIGIVADTNGKIDNFLILNARRDNGGVVIQSFSEIMNIYKLISVKRIVDIKI